MNSNELISRSIQHFLVLKLVTRIEKYNCQTDNIQVFVLMSTFFLLFYVKEKLILNIFMLNSAILLKKDRNTLLEIILIIKSVGRKNKRSN